MKIQQTWREEFRKEYKKAYKGILSDEILDQGNKWFEYFIEQTLAKEREKVEKAYGGCRKCYGKGYATQLEGFTDHGKDKKWVERIQSYCSCDRGKQLQSLKTKE